jgi:hypothetical protein
MNPTDLRHAVDVLIAADPTCADRNELSDIIKTSGRLRSWLDSVDLKCSRQAGLLADTGRSEQANSMNSRQGKRSNKEAELLNKALSESVDVFARRCRQTARQLAAKASAGKSDVDELDDQPKRSLITHWVDKITGIHHTHIELDPIRDAKLWSITNTQLATRRQTDANTKTPWSQMQVDAFIAAVEASLTTGNDSSSDARTDSGGNDNDDSGDDSGGNDSDLGRSKRTANRHQRRALRTIYSTCAHRDCTVGFSACRIHHIKWWSKHLGRTDIDK